MKTRTKIAVAALIGSIVVVGASLADRREHGRHHERHGGHERGAPFMEAFDLDGDGIVTQAEIEQARRERFAKFDADDDGTLTPTEYEALWLDAMRRRDGGAAAECCARMYCRHGDAIVQHLVARGVFDT